MTTIQPLIREDADARKENANMSQTAMVRFSRVSKSFGDHQVLKDITFNVEPNKVLVLLGPSGSGKSTLLRCVNQLETIDGGRIEVNGELIGYKEKAGKLHQLHEREVLRQRMQTGMVFQNFNLFPT